MIINMAAKAATVQTYAKRFEMTSPFGDVSVIRNYKPHSGIDYAMDPGNPITSLVDGVVERVADFGSTNAGKMIAIKTEAGETHIFGHLSKFLVSEGERVQAGDLIALSGNTGHVVGDGHLHFAVKDAAGTFIDPSHYDPLIQQMAAAPDPSYLIPDPFSAAWGLVEKGRDMATVKGQEVSNEIAIWILDNLKVAFTEIGHWLINVAPETAIMLGMVFCLGAICSIPRCGQYATWSVIVGVMLEIVRKGVLFT